MSNVDEATDTAKEIVADAAEGVSEQAQRVAEFARDLSRVKIQFTALGLAAGAAMGSVIAFKFAYSRARTKYSKIADEEIAEMRRHYMEKGKALEAEAAKGDLEGLVAERGYTEEVEEVEEVEPPMVVKPPVPVPDRPIVKSPVEPLTDPQQSSDPQIRNVFTEEEVTHVWDEHEERRRRSPDKPYVIHYDERADLDYDSTTLTYYEGDDVLCRENDEIIDPDYERDILVGESNLNRFGHGSNSASVVYVRNDKLGLVFEIVKNPNYYAEEVHGFSHADITSYKNLERMRAKERDEQED